MKINAKSEKMERKHVENLRLKLRRDLPEELSEVENFTEAEHRKAICDSIHRGGGHSRKTEKNKAINYEISLMQT